jgi:hypothetical protein
MTQSEIVNKMSMEMALRLGDLSYLKTCKFYINMALTIGTEYFTRDMEEIIMMNKEGIEIDRFKSEAEAGQKLGIPPHYISSVITGVQHSTGGFLFIKSKDRELIKREIPA